MKALDLLSYPRGIAATLYVLIWTLILSIAVLVIVTFGSCRRLIDWIISDLWAKTVIFFSGGRVEVRGLDPNLLTGKGFLVLFNHSSLIDIPILTGYFPRSIRFGAKIELFKIPFFGSAMKRIGVLQIDRSQRSQVMKVYQNAISRVENGEAFALAPEGTRQKENKLGPFKRGPFEFAINAKMDLVPVIMAGAYEMLPKKSLFPGLGKLRHRVILEILPRVSTSGLATAEDAAKLAEEVRSQMLTVFEKLNRELGVPSYQ